MYDPADVEMPIAPVPIEQRHAIHEAAMGFEASAAPRDPDQMRALKAQYYGMISEVDSQLGRVVRALEERGEWDDTLVVITADHGEQLGDHGLKEKLGFFPQSYHVIGLWRDPHAGNAGRVVTRFSENVDLLPTLADVLSIDEPAQCDGRSLTPLLAGEDVAWRSAAHYEWDYRSYFIRHVTSDWPRDRSLSLANLAASVGDDLGYVQFADGTFKCFDLLVDPTWRTECRDTERIMRGAQEQLVWRQEHLRRDLTDMLLRPSRPGRWPTGFKDVALASTNI
jgi:arylsulfatase A-like enzyme